MIPDSRPDPPGSFLAIRKPAATRLVTTEIAPPSDWRSSAGKASVHRKATTSDGSNLIFSYSRLGTQVRGPVAVPGAGLSGPSRHMPAPLSSVAQQPCRGARVARFHVKASSPASLLQTL